MSSTNGHSRSLRGLWAASIVCIFPLATVAAADKYPGRAEPPMRTDAELIWAKGGPDALDGGVLYMAQCSSCHKADGTGSRAMYPPLEKSDYFRGNPRRLLAVVMEGLSEPIMVNGARYDQIMPPISYLADEEIASVLTYVLNNFGNEGGKITKQEVAAYRKAMEAASIKVSTVLSTAEQRKVQ